MSDDKIMLMRQRVVDALTMFVVAASSICLLLYVAFGEAHRTYNRFETEKLTGQAELVRGTVEEYLRSGLPLHQYAGFRTIADSVFEADGTISGIAVRDLSGAAIFGESANTVVADLASTTMSGEGMRILERDGQSTLVAPLRNRFEQIGLLTIDMQRDKLDGRLNAAFLPCLAVGFVVALMFSLYTFIVSEGEKSLVFRRISYVYVAAYLVVSAAVIYTLLSVYSEGAQAKAQAAAQTLAARLDDIAIFDLDFRQIDGVDTTLAEFRKLNPEVSSISIVTNGMTIFADDPARMDKPWAPSVGTEVIRLPLSHPQNARTTVLFAEIPTSYLLWQVARSAKNFLALFVSSAFLAVLFMELGRTLRQATAGRAANGPAFDESASNLAAILVKPAYFLAVFVDSLSYPFLPQFSQKLAAAQGVSSGLASAPFMAYYACFALALLPAGRMERKFGPRALMIAGLMVCLASYIALFALPGFEVLALARAFSGLGQGFMFIGVQSYVLNHARVTQRTQAAGVIVFGFQAGTLAGMAIGSLLVAQLGEAGIWLLSAVVSTVTCIYLLGIVPDLRGEPAPALINRGRGLLRDTMAALSDLQFVRSMALIGVPAKAIMTGVVLFATPILLNQSGFAQEEVGQMTMVYAAAVLVASYLAARFVDRTGSVEGVLFAGAMFAGLGLLILGAFGMSHAAHRMSALGSTLGMIAGLALLGGAHGLINAPVITNVAASPVASKLGASSVAATYRLLERIGHVAGPMAMAQLFAVSTQSWSLLCWVAAATVALGIVFILTSHSSSQSGYHTEPVK